MTAKGDFFPRRINQHVPDMQYAADVRYGGFGTITIPAPAAAAADGIVADLAGTVGSTAVNVEIGAKFGRNVTATASAASGANTTVIVSGRDYLGQLMTETITVANADGTTTKAGKKAFKWIDSVAVGVATTGATLDIGTGDVLGLPYKAQKLMSETVDGAVPGNAGTFVAGLASGSAQSATSADTRGTYAPHASVAPDGVKDYELGLMFDTSNLHGDAQVVA